MKAISIVVLCLLLAFACQATTIFVDDDSVGDNNGTSWDHAYNFLQDALSAAISSAKPVEIRVAQGIYRPDESSAHLTGTGAREATFQLINEVVVKGGYAGYGQDDPDMRDPNTYVSILSGDLQENDIAISDPFLLSGDPSREDNSYTILTGSGTNQTAILDGFTVIGGNANFFLHSFGGGGLCNEIGSPTIVMCRFLNNTASLNGGAIINYKSSPVFMDCILESNYAGVAGGMVNIESMVQLIRCMFANNRAEHEAGMVSMDSTITLKACRFADNSSNMGSGGMMASSSSVLLMACEFSNNHGKHGGGLNSGGSELLLQDCSFKDNTAEKGGAIKASDTSYTLKNCIFKTNSVEEDGGAVAIYGGGGLFDSCIFSMNTMQIKGGGIYNVESSPMIANCIFDRNTAAIPTSSYGGAIFNEGPDCNPILVNCLITGNSARAGGAMYNSYWSSPVISNCTIVHNLGGSSRTDFVGGIRNQGANNTKISNCILWGNRDGGGTDESAQVAYYAYECEVGDLEYNCIQGWTGTLPGTGNVGLQPLFIDAENPDVGLRDFRLLPSSSCIDAGGNSALPVDSYDIDGDGNTTELIPLDLDGLLRITDGDNDGYTVVDMGAYEADYIEVEMKFTPQTMNYASKGKWVKAHFTLPPEYRVEDVNVDKAIKIVEPVILGSQVIDVFMSANGCVEVVASFARSELCGMDKWDGSIVVMGAFSSGGYFYGTDNIKIVPNRMKSLNMITSQWLNNDCGEPDWCDGLDVDDNTVINFIDMTLYNTCCFEVVE